MNIMKNMVIRVSEDIEEQITIAGLDENDTLENALKISIERNEERLKMLLKETEDTFHLLKTRYYEFGKLTKEKELKGKQE